jgi:dehydrogenase/reductase SDR family member 12
LSTRHPLAVDAVDLALEATVVLSFSRLGYQVRRRLFRWPDDPSRLEGRVVLVTGSTSGLGRAVAERLARRGATVIVSGRDPQRTRRVRAELVEASGRAEIHDVVADLGRLDEVVALAAAVQANHDRLDALVHNAGALVHDFRRTDDGLELTVATHVVAPHLLTRQLFGLLAATPSSRVVTVASGGMYTQRLASLDLGPDHFDGVRAYALAKRAQVVLAQQWARRTAGQGVTFHAMHPGWVDTPGLAQSLPRFHHAMGPWLRTPDQGGDTIAWLAVGDAGAEPGGGGGHFWLDRHHRWVDKLPWTVTSPSAADELWHWVSERCDHVGTQRRIDPVQS